ncbi:unnamed protein product, partial [Sphenostylis stenocarpa]
LYVQTLKDTYGNLNDDIIAKQIEADFPRWFEEYDKVDWLVVIKTKPRGVVDDKHTLEIAYQMNELQVNTTIEDDPIGHLQEDEVVGEE